MALSEERSEQTQQQWLSRLARERQDLSASVEAALEDHAARGHRWQDEEMEGQNDLFRRSRDITLIPPRLSLQSRVLPAIHPADIVREASQERRPALPKAEAEEKPVPATQNQGVWARFAQRLTASFSMFGSVVLPDAEPDGTASVQENLQELPGLQEAIPSPRTFPGEPGVPAESGDIPGMRESHAPVLPQAIPGSVQNGASKQRPAGRKVRLETTSVEATPVPSALPELMAPHVSMQIREMQETKAPDVLALDKLVEDEGMTSAHLPAMPALPGYEGTTSAHLPAMEMSKSEPAPHTIAAFSGSGAFESGQCDVSVADKHVTSSSVVLVTLTANPGPVVVQYISLQPQIGFTAHLTAPAAVSVPFNYVILAGE